MLAGGGTASVMSSNFANESFCTIFERKRSIQNQNEDFSQNFGGVGETFCPLMAR